MTELHQEISEITSHIEMLKLENIRLKGYKKESNDDNIMSTLLQKVYSINYAC